MSVDLEQLLHDADATAGPPTDGLVADMAGSIRSLARRRRFVRVTGAASAATALVMFLAVLLASEPKRPALTTADPQPRADARSLSRAMAAAAAEADGRLRLVERLVAAERRIDSTRVGRAPDPLIAIRREQDRAAHLLIYEADRLARQSINQARAAEEYRRVLALFPDTPSASVARERLAEMGGASRPPRTDIIGITGATKELS